MKIPLLIALASLLLASACDQKPAPAPTSTNAAAQSTGPADAPAGYLGAVMKAQQTAVKTIDTTSIDKAIQLFAVENGRNPKDLNELVEQKFLPKIPETPYGTKLMYNAASGTVKVVPQ